MTDIAILESPHPVKTRDKAFVFFSGKHFGRDVFHFNVTALRLGRPALFLRDRSNAWYDGPDYAAALDAAGEFAARHPRAVLAGGSAGGYAALKFALDLAAYGLPVRAVAFSPQSGSGQRDLPAEYQSSPSGLLADIHYCARSEQSRDLQFAEAMQGIPGVALHRHECDTHKISSHLDAAGKLEPILEAA